MDRRIINMTFALGCFIGIMFVPTTQQQILLATAATANVISIEAKNIIEQIKEE